MKPDDLPPEGNIKLHVLPNDYSPEKKLDPVKDSCSGCHANLLFYDYPVYFGNNNLYIVCPNCKMNIVLKSKGFNLCFQI